jgi:hypothetical protein
MLGLDESSSRVYRARNQLLQESIMPRLLRRLVVVFALAVLAFAVGCSHTAPQAAVSASG